MSVAKTKALISCAVTSKLICVFVFAYAKIRFSHDAAHQFAVMCKLGCLQKAVCYSIVSLPGPSLSLFWGYLCTVSGG